MFAAALSSPGQSFALSFYIEPLIQDLEISRLAISSIYSAATLAAALALPLFGRWADRARAGRYLGTVLLLMAAGMALLASTRTVWMLCAALFTLRLLGQGAIGIGTLIMVVRWFNRRRGRAFAIVTLGYALGEIAFPGAILGLFGLVEWRGSLLVFAALYAVVFAPLAFRIGRDPVHGETSQEVPPVESATAVPSIPLNGALRTPVFYAMVAVLTLSPLILTGVIFHQVALFESLGRGAADAAQAIAAFGVAAVGGTYLSGIIVERVRPRIAVSLSLLPLSAGLVLLAALPHAPLIPIVYGILLGSSSGAVKIAGGLVWPAYYGTRHVGSIKGAVSMISNGATAAGAPVAALLAGQAGRFEQVLLPFAIVAALGAVTALFLAPPVVDRSNIRRRLEDRRAA